MTLIHSYAHIAYCVYCIVQSLISNGSYSQRFQQYADVLTEGLRSDRRWFGGWDLGRRLPFVIIGYFTVQARPSLVIVSFALLYSIHIVLVGKL